MSELTRQADEDALLGAEAFSLGLFDPSVWQAYMEAKYADVNRRTAELKRRIAERYPPGPDANGGAGSGAEPGLGDSAFGDDSGAFTAPGGRPDTQLE